MSTIESLNTFKQLGAVRVCANANQTGTYFNGPTNNGVGATFTYAAGVLTIDGVTINLNDYILFSGQTLGYQNGIYQCVVLGTAGVGAVLQRRGDYQCIEQIRGAQYVMVAAGTALAGSIWVLVEPFPAAIGVPLVAGSNNINFVQSTASGAGAFLTISGNLSNVASPTIALGNLGLHSAKAANGGGAAAFTVTDARVTATSVIVGNFQSQANASEVETIAPGAGTFLVTTTADPGVSVFSYIFTSAAQ